MGEQYNLEAIIKEHILQTWVRFFKNTSRTAKALGIGRTTLYRKLRMYGEEPSKKDRE